MGCGQCSERLSDGDLVLASASEDQEAWQRGAPLLLRAQNLARRLMETPANEMTTKFDGKLLRRISKVLVVNRRLHQVIQDYTIESYDARARWSFRDPKLQLSPFRELTLETREIKDPLAATHK